MDLIYLIKSILIKKKNISNIVKIGFVGRFSPQKNHKFFFKFLHQLIIKRVNFIAYLVGDKINNKNLKLKELIKNYKLFKNIKYLKEKQNINMYYRKFDILITTSFYGESFPNVLAESILNRTICLAPNIGENYFIINNKNLIYQKNNLEDLFKKFIKLINPKYKNQLNLIKNNLYERAKRKLSINIMLKKYNKLIRSI